MTLALDTHTALNPRSISGDRLRKLVVERTGDPVLAHEAHVVSQVLPFKVSSYVVDELIDWDRAPDDPIYRLTFPHRDMLEAEHFAVIEQAVVQGDRAGIRKAADTVRGALNPHPGDQMSMNVPQHDDIDGSGMQHKYAETLLVFPRQGQTCHSYCGYCFRWAQFVDQPDLRMAVSGPEAMTRYLDRHPMITDVLLTGGDPLVMRTDLLASYLEPLLEPERAHVDTVRIGTKAVSFWPYRLLAGPEADSVLRLLERLTAAGKHVAVMLHLSHVAELQTDAAKAALARLASTGAVLRAQAPVVRHVNDDPRVWADLWQAQVRHNVVPYYMFVERDTGARPYYGLPLARAYDIYREALQQVSGLGRTARGPVMSASPGKVVIDGVVELDGGRAFALRYLQARNPEMVGRPFFAAYDEQAQWWDELRPYGPRDRAFFGGHS
ncbi:MULTISPECIES: lysine 2,3-aminomutase [Rhodococcus]|nr:MULTISPECIES: lysine 2,3-aminomutase [Rhodococcus]MDV7245228.1 lysine 2,3-aminomutase [Rhodococcus oxybenzonivorans]MDV7272492.1 lysine 2,3-aminomutase [Rhodococcus oxybenzonivorans]MDV7336253.1 lysine 2,3-aminomutase [Rhodococcus oxybenzonivorans]MDV7342938.1 lysine 2,3-aminomutase [Rhodococcus oxybenzonivorans]MDV8025498.1 lysine 2,3-aminomutase [Rhodococcus sp. IEGM 27]